MCNWSLMGGSEGTHIVKNLKCFPNILLLILILHFQLHHHEKLWEIYRASAIFVNCVDQVLNECISNLGKPFPYQLQLLSSPSPKSKVKSQRTWA